MEASGEHKIIIADRLAAAIEMIQKTRDVLQPITGIDQVFMVTRMLQHLEGQVNELTLKYQDREGD